MTVRFQSEDPRGDTRPELAIAVEGATEEEIKRGIVAANAVFDAAGVTAWEAASNAMSAGAVAEITQDCLVGVREGLAAMPAQQ